MSKRYCNYFDVLAHLFGCGSFLTHDMYKWWPNIITLDKLFGGGAKIYIALVVLINWLDRVFIKGIENLSLRKVQ